MPGRGALTPGRIGGVVVDPSGAAIPGANVSVTNTVNGAAMNAVTDSAGRWVVSNVPSGQGKLRVDANGFQTQVHAFDYNSGRPAQYMSTVRAGSVSETVEVTAQAVPMNSRSITQLEKLEAGAKKQATNTASANVLNLQRRVAGVLPVAIDVPRTGTSFEFARALVLDEETKVTSVIRVAKLRFNDQENDEERKAGVFVFRAPVPSCVPTEVSRVTRDTECKRVTVWNGTRQVLFDYQIDTGRQLPQQKRFRAPITSI